MRACAFNEFSISANGVPGSSIPLSNDFATEESGDAVLEVGVFTAEKGAPFLERYRTTTAPLSRAF